MNRLYNASGKTKRRMRVAYVGSSLPRRCGIATFTANLSRALETYWGKGAGLYIAMNDTKEGYEYGPQVIGQIYREEPEDYRRAAALVNTAAIDLVSLQHEFGLFGGTAGDYITDFLSRVKKPVVTTLHTVLPQPDPDLRKALVEIAAFSQYLVVMNKLAIEILATAYNIDPKKICLIPHGVPDTPYLDPLYYKHQLGFAGKDVILTFGFLSPNKGIETMLRSLPVVVEKHPQALYVVLGITHPVVKKQHGEAYRESLKKIVAELNLKDHVLFQDEFVDDDTLDRYLGAADIVACPYHSGEQITSGVLSLALGKGKVVVSTPYLHAQEVLAEGRGKLVDFKDHAGFSTALDELLGDKTKRQQITGRALALGREMTWPLVARKYTDLFEKAVEDAPRTTVPARGSLLPALPGVNLKFLERMTDYTGIAHHSFYGIAKRIHGYTTDDAARALVACTYYHNLFYSDKVLPLVDRYLAFIFYARQEDGWFANFMNYERAFTDKKNSADTLGRCLWGLGSVTRLCQSNEQELLAKKVFEESLPLVGGLTYTRSLSYAALGLSAYLHSYPESRQAREVLAAVADKLCNLFQEHSSPEWTWFEPFLTYDNARLPQALLLAHFHLSREEYLETALKSLDFLTATLYHEGYFDLIGNQGWFFKGGKRASFSQQPLDAAALVETYLLASILGSDDKYFDLSLAAFQWFLGRNRLGENLYFPEHGACADGLDNQGPSKNRGAESTITFLTALMSLYYWEFWGTSPCL
ncbi:MAG: glycosyltransferase [Firmicutes bacterium]|nr:glycosyltransferase [Bacillota bacterium]